MKPIDRIIRGRTARAAAGAALLACTAAAYAQDRAELDKTQVIGNRELPKVLYIVPWKKPMPDTLSGRPVQSVLDEALAPVDREVFRRQVTYTSQLQARANAPKTEGQEARASAAPAPANATATATATATSPAPAPATAPAPNNTTRPAPPGASR